MIVLVCGLGRCGSSMTCQMLHNGGMRVAGTWPMFELPTQAVDPGGDWMLGWDGGAVKVLEPAEDRPITGPEYRVIWLDRDMREQARSWAKWYRERHGGSSNRAHVKHALADLRKNRVRNLLVAKRLSSTPPLRITFEESLAAPLQTALRIRDFVGEDLDVKRMAAGVLSRSPKCNNGLLENTLANMRLGHGV